MRISPVSRMLIILAYQNILLTHLVTFSTKATINLLLFGLQILIISQMNYLHSSSIYNVFVHPFVEVLHPSSLLKKYVRASHLRNYNSFYKLSIKLVFLSVEGVYNEFAC